jgi:hypothetical protein
MGIKEGVSIPEKYYNLLKVFFIKAAEMLLKHYCKAPN